jgi:hypothetical protein
MGGGYPAHINRVQLLLANRYANFSDRLISEWFEIGRRRKHIS